MNELWTPYDDAVEEAYKALNDPLSPVVKQDWRIRTYNTELDKRIGYLRALDDLGVTGDPREFVAVPKWY